MTASSNHLLTVEGSQRFILNIILSKPDIQKIFISPKITSLSIVDPSFGATAFQSTAQAGILGLKAHSFSSLSSHTHLI